MGVASPGELAGSGDSLLDGIPEEVTSVRSDKSVCREIMGASRGGWCAIFRGTGFVSSAMPVGADRENRGISRTWSTSGLDSKGCMCLKAGSHCSNAA